MSALPWRSRPVLVSLAALALLAVGVLVFGMRPLSVPLAAYSAEETIQVFGLGSVEARVLSRVGFEVPGQLARVTADHGDRVQAGAPLALIHDAEQRARLNKARAALSQAEATLAKAQAGQGRAEALLAQRRQDRERLEALLQRQTISQEDVDAARTAEAVARADVSVAGGEVSLARAGLADARAQLELEQVLLDQHRLLAPYDARVVERLREPGAVLSPGEPLFTLIDPDSVWILAHVDEARAGGLRLGQRAEIRLRSLPQARFHGEVLRIGIESDRVSEERRVYVRCQDCPEDLHLGEQSEVLIETARLRNALLLPLTAVADDDGRHGRVWVLRDGRLTRTRVELGARTLDGRVQIVAGLAENDRLVAEPRPGLREGRRARAAEDDT